MLTALEILAWLLLLATFVCWGCTVPTNLFRTIAKAPRWWTRLISVGWPLLILLILFGVAGYFMVALEWEDVKFSIFESPYFFTTTVFLYQALLFLTLGLKSRMKAKRFQSKSEISNERLETARSTAQRKAFRLTVILTGVFSIVGIFISLLALLLFFGTAYTARQEQLLEDLSYLITIPGLLILPSLFYAFLRRRLIQKDPVTNRRPYGFSKSYWLMQGLTPVVLLLAALLSPLWLLVDPHYNPVWVPEFVVDAYTPHDAFYPFLMVIPAYLLLVIAWHLMDHRRWKKHRDRVLWRLGRRWVMAAFVPQLSLLSLVGLLLVIQWQARLNLRHAIEKWDAAFKAEFELDHGPEARKTREMYLEIFKQFDYQEPAWASPGQRIYSYNHDAYQLERFGWNEDKPLSEFSDFDRMVKFYASKQNEIETLSNISRRTTIEIYPHDSILRDHEVFSLYRPLCSFLFDDSQVALALGEYDRVFRNIMTIRHISKHIIQDSMEVNIMIAVAVESLALIQMVKLLTVHQISDQQWEDWNDLPEIDPSLLARESAMRLLQGELSVLSYMAGDMDGNATFIDQIRFIPDEPGRSLFFSLFYLDRSMAYLRATPVYHNRVLKQYGLPTYELDFGDQRVIIFKQDEDRGIDAPGLAGTRYHQIYFKQWASLKAKLRTIRLIHAIMAYARKKGQYPENITALIPDFVNQEDLNPGVGINPIQYLLQEDGSIHLVYDTERYAEVLDSIDNDMNYSPRPFDGSAYLLPPWGRNDKSANDQQITPPTTQASFYETPDSNPE